MRDPIREEFLLGPVDRLGGLVVIAQRVELETRVRFLVQARIFSLKLLIYYQMVILKAKFSSRYLFFGVVTPGKLYGDILFLRVCVLICTQSELYKSELS